MRAPGAQQPTEEESVQAPDWLLDVAGQAGFSRQEAETAVPLQGGVSSDIYRVQTSTGPLVIKRALNRLKVEGEWRADPSRNRVEADFLEWTSTRLPSSVPALLQKGDGWFVMEDLGHLNNWKGLLLDGISRLPDAKRAGRLLGGLHDLSWGEQDCRSRFRTGELFSQLRIEPYLLETARKHPALAGKLEKEARRLLSMSDCLVHGDFSPKNILCSPDRFVLVDAEVAWYGDPAFDVSFLLNHVLLKSLFHAPEQGNWEEMIQAFLHSYASSFMHAETVQSRVIPLLPMLLLARIDGRSPVEYLDERRRQAARDFAVHMIQNVEAMDLRTFLSAWFSYLELHASISPGAPYEH